MAKKKELTLRDVLMKMERFTKDCFILHGRCFIEGEDALRISPANVYGYLTEDAAKIVREAYPDADLLEVINVRNAKDDPEHNIKVVPNRATKTAEKMRFVDRFNDYLDVEWKTFDFTDDQLDDLFNESKQIEYEILPGKKIQITKGLFPTITIKKANTELSYYAEMKTNDEHDYPGDLIHVIARIETDVSTVYLEYHWLDL